MQTFEDLCANAEAVAVEVENVAKQLQRAAQAMKKAARDGIPGKIKQAADQIDEAARRTQEIEATASRAWPINDEDLTVMLGDAYVEQLIQTAKAADVSLNRMDSCLAAFPVIVHVLPNKRAVRLDNASLATLRPSVVIKRIRDRMKKPHSRPEKFIETLFNAYRLVAGENIERGTTLVEVYSALTLLPEVRSSYGKPEFTRDIYELDASGVTHTRRGAKMSLPAATGTRSASETLSIIPPDGMPKKYYGIRFEGGA